MLKGLKNKLKRAINLDHHKVMKKALDDTTLQAQIIDQNTRGQLYEKGEDANGNSLGEYAYNTIHGTSQYAGKIEKGQRYDHVTLNDTGKFYESFTIVNQADGFIIRANSITDEGTDLAKVYGSRIVGLSAESKAEIIPEMAQRMRELALKEIAGKGV